MHHGQDIIIKYNMILKVTFNVDFAIKLNYTLIYLMLIKLLSLFGEREMFIM